jgi:alcohol dehydrogenase (cytochrome c)
VVRALDPTTGARVWEYYPPGQQSPDHSGLLATAGGVVFGQSGGALFALDAETGQELWRVALALGEFTMAAPISFTVKGRQVIAVLSGPALIVFGL